MIGIIYKDGKEIDRGILTAGKHWTPEYPDQGISICDYADAYTLDNERSYTHGDGIYFQELQEGDHVAYDSRERVDNMIHYPLPGWLSNINSPIPNHGHSIGEDGSEVIEYKGTIE